MRKVTRAEYEHERDTVLYGCAHLNVHHSDHMTVIQHLGEGEETLLALSIEVRSPGEGEEIQYWLRERCHWHD